MRGGPLGRSLASPRPAPSSPGRTASPPPSGSHVRSPGASMRQAVACPSVLSGCVLRLGQRRATRWPPPLPSRFREGRSVGRAGPAGRACARGRGHVTLGTARLRTGGEEECTGTADTNPGCNYLVRGYSPSMHYFWRGDMPHFSSPLPFQRGARGCRAAAVPRPPRMARRRPRPARAGQSRSRATAVPRPLRPAGSCTPSISAGMAPLAGASQRTPLQTGGQPGAARAAQVRRGVTAAISIWPAAPAAGQPQQV